MRNLGFVRAIILVSVCLAGVCFVAQSFGTIQQDVSAGQIATAGAQAQTATPPSTEWAAAGLLIIGLLIVLLRPRQRSVTVAKDRTSR